MRELAVLAFAASVLQEEAAHGPGHATETSCEACKETRARVLTAVFVDFLTRHVESWQDKLPRDRDRDTQIASE
jgi:hypothetical protein